ncbi:MAG: glutaminyl-peptide cyclotransferase [Acidobacteria bacterium]|nr:glutaminyl-peptide cyclotransferase [Acidobacteriota bacterium]
MQDRTASPTSLHLMRPAEPSPETGAVLGWIDFTGFLSAADARHPADVLIGIGP